MPKTELCLVWEVFCDKKAKPFRIFYKLFFFRYMYIQSANLLQTYPYFKLIWYGHIKFELKSMGVGND